MIPEVFICRLIAGVMMTPFCAVMTVIAFSYRGVNEVFSWMMGFLFVMGVWVFGGYALTGRLGGCR